MFYSSRHQHMKKPSDNLSTFHLYMCTLWMFTCQSTPRISPRTSVKTRTTPVNHPQDARGRLPPAAQHRAPGFCLPDGRRAGWGRELLLYEPIDWCYEGQEKREVKWGSAVMILLGGIFMTLTLTGCTKVWEWYFCIVYAFSGIVVLKKGVGWL